MTEENKQKIYHEHELGCGWILVIIVICVTLTEIATTIMKGTQ